MATILEPVSSKGDSESGFRLEVVSSALKGSKFDRQIESRARAILQSHSHFKGKTELVQCRCRDNCLQLLGVVPSFYLKQLAQVALKELSHQFHIENRIVVASPADEIRF
jgi:hypothetical protein